MSSAKQRSTQAFQFWDENHDDLTLRRVTPVASPGRPQEPRRPQRRSTEPSVAGQSVITETVYIRRIIYRPNPLQQRSTHPPAASQSQPTQNSINMPSSVRSSESSAPSTTFSRASGYTSQTGASTYAASNVTGFRRTLDVPGMPSADYFTSGRSKEDRRIEYSRPPTRSVIPASSVTSRKTKASYKGGMELVPYITPQQPYSQSRYGEPEAIEDDDTATVMPEDSISNVSSRRSDASGFPRATRTVYRDGPVPVRTPGRRSTYAEGTDGCAMVERKPEKF